MYPVCTFNARLLFDGVFCNRRDAAAMRSPPGPTPADVYMAKLEEKQISTAIASLHVSHRYVDDIFYALLLSSILPRLEMISVLETRRSASPWS